MARLVTFSSRPYKEKKKQIALMQANRRAFEKEMKERRAWIVKNSFNETPRLDKWSRHKRKVKKTLENMILQYLGFLDGAETASNDLAIGLGIKGTTLDMNSVEDLSYNIYLVKLTEILCSGQGANLSRQTTDGVISAVIAQLFPPTMAVKPPPVQGEGRGEQLLEQLLAIKNSNRAA